jgi:hypothetical protein
MEGFLEQIRDWIEAADCRSVTYADGSAEISDGGGEIRYIVRERNASFSIARSERGRSETVAAAGLDQADALRMLVSLLAVNVRMLLELPWLSRPVTVAELPPGYRVHFTDAGDVLVKDDRVIGTFGSGDEEFSEAAAFAHFVDLSVEEIQRRYTSSDAPPTLHDV